MYLIKPEYDEGYNDRIIFDELQRVDPEEAYRRIYLSNSVSLYFAQCQHPQETWLPLLEKAYAKAHGDYGAIDGGYGGEGLEDLTGGVTSELYISDILDKESFWKDQILKSNDEFLFACWTNVHGKNRFEATGIVGGHVYSIQKAVEIDGQRLIRLRNPWGKGEWKGPWGDGSKEWTAEWLKKLHHQFGDDGDFWISYKDFLRRYQLVERTRIFGPEWQITQTWTTLEVPWLPEYLDTYFTFNMPKSGPAVIVFSQLDERYFRGLGGQYYHELSFRVHKAGSDDYLVRSQSSHKMTRSVSVELDLEEGEYHVRVRIFTERADHVLPTQEVIWNNVKTRPGKLARIGTAYDLAHARGAVEYNPQEKAAKEALEKAEIAKTPAVAAAAAAEIKDEDLDQFEKDPWNASAVVGLKIYYQVTEEDKGKETLKLKVIRPGTLDPPKEEEKPAEQKSEEEKKKEEEAAKTETEQKKPDVDESTKDATVPPEEKERKESIAKADEAAKASENSLAGVSS